MENQWGDKVRDEIIGLVPPGAKVIGSIGCNYGSTEARLVERGMDVHGVDISPDAIEVAKTRLTSARVVDPGERHPFERHSLDGLILADVLEHIPLAWKALASFNEAVKPGGFVVISVPNMRFVLHTARFVLGGDWPEHPSGVFDETHVQVMTKKRIDRWCRDAGLTLEESCFRYPTGTRRRELFKVADYLTFKIFHDCFTGQIIGRYRKSAV